jgi:hypothetical protein
MGPGGGGAYSTHSGATLAVQLLLDLLAHLRPGEPVPVLFSVAGWDPDTYPRVQDWLATELDENYPALRAISPDASAALAARDRLLPILDGLDEVPSSRRAAIIRALNTSLGPGGLILTSRRPEYRAALTDAGDVLTGAATIGPYALTPAQAATYLDRHLPPSRDPAWDQVLTSLADGTAALLSIITSTPLGLWLVRTVIIDDRRPPGILADTSQFSSAAALRAYLLDQLIPATVDARHPVPRRRRDAPQPPLHPAHRHGEDDLRRWLTTLAEHLRANGTSDWAWWEFSRRTCPPRRSRLWLFPLFGLVGAILTWPLLGPLLGLAAGLANALMIVNSPAPRPRHLYLRPSSLTLELFAKLRLGSALALLIVLMNSPMFGVVYPLESGLGAVLATLATGWVVLEFETGATEEIGTVAADRSTSPSRSYRGERAKSVIDLLGSILAVGLAVGIGFGLQLGIEQTGVGGINREFRISTSLAMVLPVVVVSGSVIRSAWFEFFCATVRWTLRRPSQLPAPWRLMSVLEDAYRLGLLRTAGSAYQFRHAAFQGHLAPRRTASDPPER